MNRPNNSAPEKESVWDYPRPPRLESFSGRITVELGGITVASTSQAWRVLETSHPPTYYLPRDSFADGVLRSASGQSWCEWKGQATYFDLVTPTRVALKAAWCYLDPTAPFKALTGAVAVMAAQVECCTVNGEVVTPQPGGFYGGWITSWVTGPFKGTPGTMHW